MTGDFGVPKELPPDTPATGRKLYAWLFLVVACLFLLSIGLEKAQLIPAGVTASCRAYRLCGLPPQKPLPPLAADWLASGATWDSVANPTLAQYRQNNPEYEIAFHKGEEHGSCDGKVVKIDCKYCFEGTFSGEQKWRGLLEYFSL